MSTVSAAPGVIELHAGAARLRLAPQLGGRITACTLAGADGGARAVLHPYPEQHTDLDQWGKGGLYPLVPYSGRVRDAMLWHAGRAWPLQAHAGSAHTLHGIAHRRAWSLVGFSADRAALRYTHAPDVHWPWAFEVEMGVALSPGELSVQLRLCNTGTEPMPAGIGLHPYLVHATDEPLRYRADAGWPFDADYLALPRSGTVDASVIEQTVAPAQWQAGEVTRFHGRWQGALELLDASTGRARLALRGSGALDQLLIHRPAAAPYLCAEPVSHVVDGFNLAARGEPCTGTRVIGAGESLYGGMVIAAL